MTRSLGTAISSTKGDRRRLSECLGIVVSLVVFYFLAHWVWTGDEPDQMLWTGPVGAALEWMWWAGIGAAVRALTTSARSSYKPVDASRLPASRWIAPFIVVFTAMLVLILFGLRLTGQIDASAAIVAFDFGTSPSEILVLIAFGLGFFHLLVVAYLQLLVRSAWKAAQRLPDTVRNLR